MGGLVVVVGAGEVVTTLVPRLPGAHSSPMTNNTETNTTDSRRVGEGRPEHQPKERGLMNSTTTGRRRWIVALVAIGLVGGISAFGGTAHARGRDSAPSLECSRFY